MNALRVYRQGLIVGYRDFRDFWTLRSWLCGWMLRILTNSMAWVLLGRVVGSEARVSYLLVGNAVATGPAAALWASNATTWARYDGTHPLLVIAPTSLILSTVLLPSAGWARVLGHDVATETRAVRPLIGIVFGGDKGLYMRLTARQNLEYWAALYQVPPRQTRARVEQLLERTGLTERADHLVQTYSRGMKQRLHLARGLVGNARVLYLDEPTLGMDPMAARDFRQIVKDLREEGRTILLTTHDMAEAEALCDQVALIDHGKVLAVETPARLSEYVAKFERIDFDGGDPELIERLHGQEGVAAVKKAGQGLGHRVELSNERALENVLALLISRGVTSIRTSRPSLEEVYVHLIGDRGLTV